MALFRCGGGDKSNMPQYAYTTKIISGGTPNTQSGDFVVGTPVTFTQAASNISNLTLNVENVNSITVSRSGNIQYSSGNVLINKDGTTSTFTVGSDPIDVSNAVLMTTSSTTDSSNTLSFTVTVNS